MADCTMQFTWKGRQYHIGEFCYFGCALLHESYYVGRILEVLSGEDGKPQMVRVNWLYRRHEIPDSAIKVYLAMPYKEYTNDFVSFKRPRGTPPLGTSPRELFCSTHTDIAPIASVRAVCTVTHLSSFGNSNDRIVPYLSRSDSFFYALLYDHNLKRLSSVSPEFVCEIKVANEPEISTAADTQDIFGMPGMRGKIRVGDAYQCKVPENVAMSRIEDMRWRAHCKRRILKARQMRIEAKTYLEKPKPPGRVLRTKAYQEAMEYHLLALVDPWADEVPTSDVLETIDTSSMTYLEKCWIRERVWALPSSLSEEDLDMYLLDAKSLFAYGALYTSAGTSIVTDTSREGIVSWDSGLEKAVTLLHHCDYNIENALGILATIPEPTLGLEMWSDEEAKAFVDGFIQYGKRFDAICKGWLPHKSVQAVVEYFWLWYKSESARTLLQSQMVWQQASVDNVNPDNPCDGINMDSSVSCDEEELASDSGDDSDIGNSFAQGTTASMISNTSVFSDASSQQEQKIHSSANLPCHGEAHRMCFNCHSTASSHWHRGGPEKRLLCSPCRLHWKKYMTHRPTTKTTAPTPHLKFEFKKETNIYPSSLKRKYNNSELTPRRSVLKKGSYTPLSAMPAKIASADNFSLNERKWDSTIYPSTSSTLSTMASLDG